MTHENVVSARSVTIMIHTDDDVAITSYADVPVSFFENLGTVQPRTARTLEEASLTRIAFHENISREKVKRLEQLLREGKEASKAFRRCRGALIRNEAFLRKLRMGLDRRMGRQHHQFGENASVQHQAA